VTNLIFGVESDKSHRFREDFTGLGLATLGLSRDAYNSPSQPEEEQRDDVEALVSFSSVSTVW
jgi:hypothetical protein